MIHKFDDRHVLATFRRFNSKRRQITDTFSPEIPISMDHRCLRYSHMVVGNASLVVGFLKDYYELLDISYNLNAHGPSSFINFSRSAVILPSGLDFKV